MVEKFFEEGSTMTRPAATVMGKCSGKSKIGRIHFGQTALSVSRIRSLGHSYSLSIIKIVSDLGVPR